VELKKKCEKDKAYKCKRSEVEEDEVRIKLKS
jgi:hypothetical protein